MRCRGYTACGGACFRGAGPVPWHRHRRAVVPSHGLVAGDERQRTSRGRHSAPRAPQESGATTPGTRRRPGQTDTRARGSTDHRPPARHPPPTIDYQGPAPFSSFRVPQGDISDRHRIVLPRGGRSPFLFFFHCFCVILGYLRADPESSVTVLFLGAGHGGECPADSPSTPGIAGC